MKKDKLISCYAHALFKLSNKEFDIIERDIQFLLSFFKENKEVGLFLSSPVNSTKIKNDLVFLFEDHISNTLLNLILLIISNKRFFLLESILRKSLALIKKFRNKIDVLVISAISLSKNDIDLVNNSISDFGEVIGFTNVVDPSILGGFIVKIGFTVIDASLKSYLKRLLKVSEEAISLKGV